MPPPSSTQTDLSCRHAPSASIPFAEAAQLYGAREPGHRAPLAVQRLPRPHLHSAPTSTSLGPVLLERPIYGGLWNHQASEVEKGGQFSVQPSRPLAART